MKKLDSAVKNVTTIDTLDNYGEFRQLDSKYGRDYSKYRLEKATDGERWEAKKRERGVSPLSTGDANIDDAREQIHFNQLHSYNLNKAKPYVLAYPGTTNADALGVGQNTLGTRKVVDFYRWTLKENPETASGEFKEGIQTTLVNDDWNGVAERSISLDATKILRFLPFEPTSSSANGVQAINFKKGPNPYGETYEFPMMGPYTKEAAGENAYNPRFTLLETDTTKRPEAYSLIIDQTAEKITLSHPRNTNTASYSPNIPVGFYRDEYYKTVSIKNIEDINYTKNYQVVQGAKPRFHKRDRSPTTSSIPYLFLTGSGDYRSFDFELSDKTTGSSESVIISRFSAPGGKESMTEGRLDQRDSELSAYNAMPYRNIEKIDERNDLLSRRALNGYYDSVDGSPTASFHKTHNNRRQRPNAQTTSSYVSVFDNGFVSRNIPYHNLSYMWLRSAWANYIDAANGLTGSDSYTARAVDNTFLFGVTETEEFIIVTASKDGTNVVGYLDNGDTVSTTMRYTEQSDTSTLMSPNDYTNANFDLNVYLLNQNGPYEHSGWKTNSLVTNQKQKDIRKFYSVFDLTNENVFTSKHQGAVTFKHKPVNHVVQLKDGPYRTSYSYGNNIHGYAESVFLSSEEKIINSNKEFKYDKQREEELFVELSKQGLNHRYVKYGEYVFPKDENVGNKEVRGRYYDGQDYFDFQWKDAITDRNESTNIFRGDLTNLSFATVNSIWSTDYYMSASISGSLMQHPKNRGGAHLLPCYVFTTGSAKLPDNTVQSSSRGPFSDTYGIWQKNLRAFNREYSLLPEFKISTFVEDIIETDGDFFSKDSQAAYKFEISHSDFTSLQNATTQAEFLERLSNSDAITNFSPAVESYSTPEYIEVSLESLIKFLPEEKLYPQNYCLDITKKFLQKYIDDDTSVLVGSDTTDEKASSLLEPYFAPGIFFNTIKSGVAVSYPVVVSNGSSKISSSISFESIVEPSTFLQDISGAVKNDDGSLPIYDRGSIDATSSITPRPSDRGYDYISSQYHAETLNFFVDGLSNFKTEDNIFDFGQFGPLTSSAGIKKFIGDVVLESSGTMCSDPQKFGEVPYYNFLPPYYTIGDHATASYSGSVVPNEGNIPATDTLGLGAGVARITFDPANIYSVDPEKFMSGKFTASDILNNTTIEYYNLNLQTKGDSSYTKYMELRDSVNILHPTPDGRLVISTKYETPFIDMSSATVVRNGAAAANAPKMLWLQHGTIPSGSKGLKLRLEDVSDRFAASPASINISLTGSLWTALKFDKEETRVGEVPSTLKLEEGVIAIPYYVSECGEEEFYDYNLDTVEASLSKLLKDGEMVSVSPDRVDFVSRQMLLMNKYVLPPTFDWLKYRLKNGRLRSKDQYRDTLPPCAMYIFENEMLLEKQDVADIWQGVAPSTTNDLPTPTKAKILHKVSDVYSEGLKEGTRWKIFKIKKRAAQNYFKEIERQTGVVSRKTTLQDIDYSFNYPYDYFSITEGVKMSVDLIMSKKQEEQ